MIKPERETWLGGLHALHCREDRCSIGCSCPCHTGEVIPPLRRRRWQKLLARMRVRR